MKKYCMVCGHEMEAYSTGWMCGNCHTFEDMGGAVFPREDKPFMPKLTNADRIREKMKDDTELAKSRIRRDDVFSRGIDLPGRLFETPQEALEAEIDWIKQPVKEDV